MQPASVSFFRFIISVILPPAARGNRRWLLRLRGRASERKRCATVVRASAPREAPIFGRARCCSCRRVCASARSTRSRGCDALWPRGARVLSAANAGQAATPVSSDLSTARAARGARRARAHLERADTIPACPPEATAATGSACALVSCPAATVVSCPVATLNKLGHVHRHLLDVRVVELLDLAQRAHVVLRHEVDRDALAAKATRAANAVDVVLAVRRQVVVDHEAHLLHVDAARKQVRRDEDARRTRAELAHDELALLLVHVGMHRGAREVT
mmetsp:Transcript_17729/g.55205  ORF Transcript_17729/g.55205 Transcript_17729/m.55205 type:complete len:274 (-) Transcript_17729:945-1766(-)